MTAYVPSTRIQFRHHCDPDVRWSFTLIEGDERSRRDVFYRGTYIGQVVYRGRKLKQGGTEYGWQPAKAPKQSALTSSSDAIKKLMDERVRRMGWLAHSELDQPHNGRQITPPDARANGSSPEPSTGGSGE